jgi:Protein of unknown function (DUF2798)
MLAIPRRYSHFVFGAIQSGLTSFVAAGIASAQSIATGSFVWNWLISWLVSWIAMAPVVLLAAPAIRLLSLALTRDETTSESSESQKDTRAHDPGLHLRKSLKDEAERRLRSTAEAHRTT